MRWLGLVGFGLMCGVALGQAVPSPAELEVARLQKQLQDWPNLARYQGENASLPALAPGAKRIVFFGDSITEIWKQRHPEFFANPNYVDRGISGQTTPQMVLRFQQDVVALKPAAVVILAGINDIAGNTGPSTLPMIEDNFRALVAMGKAAGVRVVLCSVLPANNFPWRPGVLPAPSVKQLNVWLQQFAQAQHVTWVDYYPAMVDANDGLRKELGTDAVHPNTAGYQVMEPIVVAGIKKALATR